MDFLPAGYVIIHNCSAHTCRSLSEQISIIGRPGHRLNIKERKGGFYMPTTYAHYKFGKEVIERASAAAAERD